MLGLRLGLQIVLYGLQRVKVKITVRLIFEITIRIRIRVTVRFRVSTELLVELQL